MKDFVKTLSRYLASSCYKVEGNSMQPTLADGQYVLVLLETRSQLGPLSRGQIVVLRNPILRHRVYIKRVIGLPNESILLRDGVLYIDDQKLDEPYLGDGTGEAQQGEWWNGPGEYFLMGDNRRNSRDDSRAFGPVTPELILGRVWLSCWPPGSWGKIR